MSHWESILFRLIPLVMAGICLGLGQYVWHNGDSAAHFIAGHVTTSLTAICLCLFSTACTIIRQLLGCYTTFDKVFYPLVAISAAATSIIWGAVIFFGAVEAPHKVAGLILIGVGLICCSISTVVLSSREFSQIPKNSKLPEGSAPLSPAPHGPLDVAIEIHGSRLIPLTAWVLAFTIILSGDEAWNYIAGHVMFGLAAITTCLIGLTHSVVRQAGNTYSNVEGKVWPWLAGMMGAFNIIYGLLIIIMTRDPSYLAPGIVMIGLGLVCWSILSKVALLSLVWRKEFPFANRIPMIPVGTALTCVFMSAFFTQAAMANGAYFIPSVVLVGLGAICFTLFSIVSILESGTS